MGKHHEQPETNIDGNADLSQGFIDEPTQPNLVMAGAEPVHSWPIPGHQAQPALYGGNMAPMAPAHYGPRIQPTSRLDVTPDGTRFDLQAADFAADATPSARNRIAGIVTPDVGHPEVEEVYSGWRTILRRGAIAGTAGLVGLAAVVVLSSSPNSAPTTPDASGDDRETSASAVPPSEAAPTASVIAPIDGDNANQAPAKRTRKAEDAATTTTVAPPPLPPAVTTANVPSANVDTNTLTQEAPTPTSSEVVNSDDPVSDGGKGVDSNGGDTTTANNTDGSFTDSSGDTATKTNDGGDGGGDEPVAQDQHQQNTGN